MGVLVLAVHLGQLRQFLDNAPPLAVPQQGAMLAVQRHPLPLVVSHCRQGQGNVVGGMAAVQHFVDWYPL